MNLEELEIVKQRALENHIPILMDDTLETIKEILEEKKPKRILEIGTAVGYSASQFVRYAGEQFEIVDTIELDEQGEAILDADGYPMPMEYDAVELLVGYNTDRNTALVEVTDITIELTGYVFDDRGHEYPHGIVSFHLGEVIEKNIH